MFIKALLRRGGVAGITAIGSIVLCFVFLAASVVWDEQFGPILRDLNEFNNAIKMGIDENTEGSYALEVFGNTIRSHINFAHVVISMVAIFISSLTIGMYANWAMGGTRTWFQRIEIAFYSVPISVVIATVMFAFSVWDPSTYRVMLSWAEWAWRGILYFLESMRETIPWMGKLLSLLYAQQGGHSFMFMAAASMLAMFIVNSIIAMRAHRR